MIAEKWQVSVRLRFPGKLLKRRVYFYFEWGAWVVAYDHLGLSPGEFHEMDIREQLASLYYGAAVWACMKRKEKQRFNFDQLTRAIMKASREDNERIGDALSYSQRPDWLKKEQEDGDDVKKK